MSTRRVMLVLASTICFTTEPASAGPFDALGGSISAIPRLPPPDFADLRRRIYEKAQELARRAGPGPAFVFDVATFASRYELELLNSGGQAASNILQGQNILQLVATPLAAAIREGRQRYVGNVKSLPADVKAGLAPYFPPEILDRAVYTVGKIELTLPNGIGKLQSFGDERFAVVVDDVIVFNSQPPAFRDAPWWWAHEVTHVEQYAKLGVDEFARVYVFSGGADLETPADKRGDLVLQDTKQNGQASPDARAIPHPTPRPSRPLYPVAQPRRDGVTFDSRGRRILPP